MFNKKCFAAFIAFTLITVSGCSSNKIKPIASYSEPHTAQIIFNSGFTAERAMELIEFDLKAATGIKDKQRYNQTTDVRVPRPDLVLGKVVSKECSSEASCTFTFVFHKGQVLGETKQYNQSTGLLENASKHTYKKEATTTQTIIIPVELIETNGGGLKANIYIDGTVKTQKYEGLFGLTNIISGSTYSPLLKEKDIVRILNAMAKIAPAGSVKS